jgi:membrane-bound ClpP family serine protease
VKKKAIIISVCVVAILAAILVPIMLLSNSVADKVVVIPLSGTITTGDYSSLSGSTITPGLVRGLFVESG